jgi:DNA-binding transcriptional regulator YiaG
MGAIHATEDAMDACDIRTLRKNLHLTQAQFATALGYSSRTQITVFENGRGTPSKQGFMLLQAIADGYRPAGWPGRA